MKPNPTILYNAYFKKHKILIERVQNYYKNYVKMNKNLKVMLFI